MEQPATETNLLRILSNQLADAVERVAPALVLVNGRQRQPASGLVFAPDHVLTANHVLERQEEISIETHDKRTLAARLVGRDPSSDLAVLRVENLGLTPPTLADEPARVGQLILAVGRSSSEGPMASSGIVSAIGGPLRAGRDTVLERYIRTDATPYPGFSGGALIDTQGSVLGMLTTGLINGIALALPASIAWSVAGTLAQQGHVKRGYLGISSQIVQIPAFQRAGRSQDHGLLIVKVDDDSPAQKGGMLMGDILVGIDGHAVSDSEDLHALLSSNRVGKTVPVDVIRGNRPVTLQVTIGQRS